MAKKKKVAIVVGTRPEVIKMAQVYKALKNSDKIEPLIISTAQHRQMLDQTMEIFAIKSDFDMNIMRVDQTLNDITVRIIKEWGKLFPSKTRGKFSFFHPHALIASC